MVEIGLASLEAEGFVLRGCFDAEAGGPDAAPQFCARRLLARIHADSQARRRASVEPVSAQDLRLNEIQADNAEFFFWLTLALVALWAGAIVDAWRTLPTAGVTEPTPSSAPRR